ncbi:MAG TPA: polyphosphate kinase 1 [Longimicrobium sp.]|jgi:polyphosphate kinase|nr:polyphosphate kinase 1 [Longimicrobium sp.]
MTRAGDRPEGAIPEPGGELVVRFSAPDRETLERVAHGPLPGAAADGDESTEIFRDVYYDTPELDLRRRGATAGVRFHATGELTLAVEVRDWKRGRPASAAASARGATPEALFADEGEAGALLRALVDPARLHPWLEVETRRRLRAAVLASAGRALPVEVACDERMVRDRDVSAELFEVEVRLPADTAAARAAARALERELGLTLLTGDPLRRWARGLEETEVDWLEEAVRSARRVAVVSYRGGRVALLRREDALEVPSGPGTGVDAARRILRSRLGAEGRVRFMGTGPGSTRQPATEVWLSEDAEVAADAAGVLHLPIDELIRAAGSPSLRDDATLAALHVLARSDIPVHPLSPAWDESDDLARDVLRAAPALPAPPSAIPPEALPPGTLLNPELSVLAFNRRVLELAADPEVPLLERVRFLSIFGGNLDEFFRVRVAGYKREVVQGSTRLSLDGVTPREQLDAVGTRARRLADAAYRLLFDGLLPELREHGVEVVRRSGLDAEERARLREYYDAEVHALLTPLAAGPGHPFPHIRNQRPALVALLREPLTGGERLGVVELPDGLPRFIPLPEGGRFATLETVIVDNLHRLYPGMEVDAASTFRVTRSAELLLDDTRVVDLLEAVEEEVRRRRSRPVVRVEVEDSMVPRLRALLLRELRHDTPEQAWPLGDEDVYEVEGLIDLRGLRELASLEIEGGHWPPEEPRAPLDPTVPMVEVLRRRELLVEFPRDSFEATVERFVVEAAEDPDVVAVKLALYRTNRRSRIVEALRRASSGGKQVVALVELTARFDEERNIEWARYLRTAGIHVVYGMPGLKVHAKVALVVRREPGGVRRYAYVGTGNLNATTAAAYTDLGLLTADPGITDEVAELFNALTGAGAEPRHRLLLVAPEGMRGRFVEMIDREAEHVRAGRGGHLVAKVNGLADRDLIAALYRASEAGVKVDLIVRSLCALRPGVAGLSENIRVVSVLGRYLEHARIFRFANGGDPEYYIGSADWRTRNLSRRVEVATPVRDPEHRVRLDAILEEQLAHPRAWELGSDGTYYRRPDRAPRDPALPPPEPGRVAIITG